MLRRITLLPLVVVLLVLSGCGDEDKSDGSDLVADGTDGVGDTAGPDGTNPGDTNNPGDSTNPSDISFPPEMCDTPLTEWEQFMLDKHNEWRASVQPPAANMHRVHWDTNIAQNAADWVSSCDPDWPHSPEERHTNVGGYEVLGENLSYCAGTGCSDLPEVTDGSGEGDGEGWWNERHDYDWATDSSTGGQTAHYTQMVSSNVYAIGCATQRCDAPGPFGWDGEWWWTICQYGPRGDAYWVGNKPYESGSGGLIEPAESVYDMHPGLCRSAP